MTFSINLPCFQKLIQDTKQLQLNLTLDENTIGKVIKLVRNCNVTLHWVLLHTATPSFPIEDLKKSRTLRQLVVQESKYSIAKALQLLLSTAQIEHEVKEMYKQVIELLSLFIVAYKKNCFLN